MKRVQFLHTFLDRFKAADSDIPTRPFPPYESPASAAILPRALEPSQLLATCSQSVGQQRDHNEDALFSLTSLLTSGSTILPFGIYMVADGMGGHQHGEVASEIAIRSMASYLVQKLHEPFLNPLSAAPEVQVKEIMQAGVQEAHKQILKDVPGGGTTLTAALIFGDQVTVAHVGDSRAYLVSKEGQLQTLTRDHSLVKRLVELGQITSDEAAVHPQRNVLYRALGQGEPFDADIETFPLPVSGFLLLCSDGLWGVISEDEIRQTLTLASNLAQACQDLVTAANAAGGPDNITAILVRLPDRERKPPTEEQAPG